MQERRSEATLCLIGAAFAGSMNIAGALLGATAHWIMQIRCLRPQEKNHTVSWLLLSALLVVSPSAAWAQFCPGYQAPGSYCPSSGGYGLGYVSPNYSRPITPYYRRSINPFYGCPIQPFVYNYCPQPPLTIDSYCPLYPPVEDNGDPYSPRTSSSGRAAADRINTLTPSLVNHKDLPNTRTISGPGDMTDVIGRVFGKRSHSHATISGEISSDEQLAAAKQNGKLKQNSRSQEDGPPSACETQTKIDYWSDELKKDPGNTRAFYNRGLAWYQSGNCTKALEDYKRVLSTDPGNESCLYNQGLAFAGLKEYQNAIESFNKAIQINPNSSRCYYRRGLTFCQSGALDKALESLNKAVNLDPQCYHSLYSRALVYFKLGDFNKASADATKAISINNTYAPAYYMLGTALSELRKYEEAVSAFTRAIKADPKNARAYLGRGSAYYNLAKLIPAIKDFNRVLALNPQETSTYFMRGLVYFRLAQYFSAIEDYNRYLAVNPNQTETLINRGSAYYELDDWTKAIEDYNRALRLNTKSIPCLYKRSICKLSSGDGQGAAEDAYQALKLSKPDEKQYPYLSILAYIGYIKANQIAKADAVLDQSILNLKSSIWPAPVLKFLKHKLTEQQLVAMAAKDNLFLTQAHTYLGLFYAFSRQARLALIHLEWVKNKGENSLPEYGLAVAQLFRDKQKDTTNITRPIHDKWALVIGIGKFSDSSISTLKYSDKDAKDFSNYLVSNAHFPPGHVKLLTNEQATRENILAHLGNEWLPRVTHPDDVVLVYFSTHGSPAGMDKNGVNYLVTHNTDTQCLHATGIPIQDLTRLIKKRVHADRVVVMLDACHSGSAEVEKDRTETDIKAASTAVEAAVSSQGTTPLSQNSIGNINAEEVAKESEQLVICSSQPNELSWESKQYPNSVFTHHLISGLKLKGQSTKLEDAYEYAREQVVQEVLAERNAHQTPVLKSKWKKSDLNLAAPTRAN